MPANKNVNRKVQGMPQSQTAANPRHQEKEKWDKIIHAQNKQTNIWNANPRHQEKEQWDKIIHAQNKQTNIRNPQRPDPSSPSEVIRMLKQSEKRGQEHEKTLKIKRPVV